VKNVMVVQVAALRVERSEQAESKLITERESRIPKTDGSYTWLEDYLVRLDGKEARDECYAWLE